MQEEITIDKAEKFFLNGETRAAGHTAGILFEQSVRKLCAFHQMSLSNSLSTRELLDLLCDTYVISREMNRKLQNLVSIRNKCAHGNPVTTKEVQTLIQRTKTFIRWVESQSSIAPSRPLATPPLASRKHLVCPICGKDNRVRKVSGLTRNSLLAFPAPLSPWDSNIFRESKRMSGREQSFYALGCLIFILGFVLSCAWFVYTSSQGSAWLYLFTFGISIIGAFIGFRFRRRGTERLKEDHLKAFEIWDTLYYCDRDDALFSSERPEYHVSAANMREMLGY